MPEYLSPGVYVEEIKIGSKPIEGVSTSTAGFLGEAERGPTTPRLVASWLQFQRVFGSFFGANKYLPYAVQGFFDNGGRRCYIGRIVKAGAAPATMATLKLTVGGADALTVDATGEGKWGNNIALKVSAGTMSGFKLKVFYWKAAPSTLYDPDTDLTSQPRPQVTEFFDNLSVSESSPDCFEKRVNGISNLLELSVAGADSAAQPDGPVAITSLAGGGDGTGDLIQSDYERTDTVTPGNRKGLTGFAEVDEISIVYAPNAQVFGSGGRGLFRATPSGSISMSGDSSSISRNRSMRAPSGSFSSRTTKRFGEG